MSFAVSAPRTTASPDLIRSVLSPSESFSRLRVAAEIQAKATLTVRTSEGDTVTLSAGRAARADLSSIAYDRTGRSTAPDLSAQLASAELTTLDAVEAIVEGDLNEQEREDLDALLTSIDDIAAAFFSGRIDQAVVKALEIQDFGSLQSYRFDASYSTSTRIEEELFNGGAESSTPEAVFAESDALAGAIEDFFASFLRQRDERTPLTLRGLLPSPAAQEDDKSEPSKIDVQEEVTADSGKDPQHQAEPSPEPVEQAGPRLDVQPAKPEAVVAPEAPAPESKAAPIESEPEPEPATTGDLESVVDEPESDPLAAFAQQIRERVEASGLTDTRLGPYVPSLIRHVVEYRISLLIASLVP